MSFFKQVSLAACVAATVLSAPAVASAASFTASEFILDGRPYDLANVNLSRDRTDSTGTTTESDGATVRTENNVSTSFGLLVNSDVSYTHDLTWVTPPATSFTSATLTIYAFGSLANDDLVTLDTTVQLGSLSSGVFTTSVFDGAGVLTALNDNGKIDVFINKNAGGGWANLNLFSVYGSHLEAHYDGNDTGDPVPEPVSLALLGLTFVGGAIRLRRRQ